LESSLEQPRNELVSNALDLRGDLQELKNGMLEDVDVRVQKFRRQGDLGVSASREPNIKDEEGQP